MAPAHESCSFAKRPCSLSRCGSRTGGQSFVKVKGAPRSPETRVWRRRRTAAKWDWRTSGPTASRKSKSQTAKSLLLKMIQSEKSAPLWPSWTLTSRVAPCAFTPLLVSPFYLVTATATPPVNLS